MTTTIPQSNGSKILLTLPIPSFKSLLMMNHAKNQIMLMPKLLEQL